MCSPSNISDEDASLGASLSLPGSSSASLFLFPFFLSFVILERSALLGQFASGTGFNLRVSSTHRLTTMRPTGAYMSIEPIVDRSAISMVLPAAPNMGFLTGRVDLARRGRSPLKNQVQFYKCTNGSCFSAVSPPASLPRHRRDSSASNATAFFSKGSSSALTGVTVGGILAACFAVLLLFFVPCYLKHRRHHSRSTLINDVECGMTGFELRSVKTLSIRHPDYLPQRISSPAPSVSQPSSRTAAIVISQASPFSNLTGDMIREALLPARPAPLPPSLGRANREKRQGDSSGTAIAISPPALPSSRVTDERIRKAFPPARPPPLLLLPERAVRKAQKSEPIPLAKSRTISLTGGDNRGSLLPNPWDSNVEPQRPPAAFEWESFKVPSFIAPVRPANTYKVGLPRTPRDTRNFVPKVRALVTEDVVYKPGVKRKRHPPPM